MIPATTEQLPCLRSRQQSQVCAGKPKTEHPFLPVCCKQRAKHAGPLTSNEMDTQVD